MNTDIKNESETGLKILLVFTANMNLGDSVLAENDYCLIDQALADRKHTIYRYGIALRDIGQIRYMDAVIFGGGIIKATNEKFWLFIPEIVDEAQKYDVPVFFSAIGVEKFYPDNKKSVSLKRALNQPCVKGISCRDDIGTLLKDYIENKDISVTSVYDPAVWCRETYKKDIPEYESRDTLPIGLGVVRWKLFADYGNPQITKQYQLKFWKKTAELLEQNNLPWVIFTNGDKNDEKFANEVLEYIGHGKKEPIPYDDHELVRMISGYRGVIAGRMHSNIVAYALGIQSVGFIWNQKLIFWSEKTGLTDHFLPVNQMKADLAVSTLLEYLDQPLGPSSEQKMPVYDAIKNFIDNHVIERKEAHADWDIPDFRNRMIAMYGGGIDIRYDRLNSPAALKFSYEHGFRNFQISVRMTKDGHMVSCVPWNVRTYRMMNLGFKLPLWQQPALSEDEFRKAKYYRRFETADFETVLKAFAQYQDDSRIWISLENPNDLRSMVTSIVNTAVMNHIKCNQIVLCLDSEKNMETLMQMRETSPYLSQMKRMYSLNTTKYIPKQFREQILIKAADFVRKYEIDYISVIPEFFNEKAAQILKDCGSEICIFSYKRASQMIEAFRLGAEFAASGMYPVDYMETLMKK